MWHHMTVQTHLKNRIFSQLHLGNLVYNTCWEDPRCDRSLLDLGPDSRVVMITSAGCNALDYLLDNPAQVHCVDMNPRQNAVLELKTALFQRTDHGVLYDFFGRGRHSDAQRVYNNTLNREVRSDYARKYWQRHMNRYFGGRNLRNSFYWHGSSGMVAWMFYQWMSINPDIHRTVKRLFAAPDLQAQAVAYERLEPMVLNRFVRWVTRQHLLQTMLGVPVSQQKMAAKQYDKGMTGYIQACLRRVFTQTPIHDNYFWQLYMQGQYTESSHPNYLAPAHFTTLQERVHRVQTHTTTISRFLQEHPGTYSHYVLLDHQDWMAANNRPALEEEWRLVLQNAAKGTRILLRSANADRSFLPVWLNDYVAFDDEAVQRVDPTDRVGTYASTHLGIVTRPLMP
jgi:S-adenosylmethionine-diacylglycerol 3-amino-3-carboxypropyl transferase